MVKLSGRQLYVTNPVSITELLKIMHISNDKNYYLVCENEQYKLAQENDYLIWKIPNNIFGTINFSIKSFDSSNILLYETNVISVDIKEPSQVMTMTNASLDESLIYDMNDQHPIIEVINRRVLMTGDREIVVSRDNLSQLLTFELDRFFDGVDLSLKTCYIKYINAAKQEGKSIAVNIDYDDTKIRIGWLINESVTFQSGDVLFAIEFIGYNEYGQLYRWQTAPSYLPIGDGLWIDDEIIEQQYPSIIEDLLIRVNWLYTNSNGGVSTTEKDPIYLADKPNIALKSEVDDNDLSNFIYDASSRKLSVIKNNGIQVSTIIPQASDTLDGLMTTSDRQSIVSLVNDVTSLKQGGVWRAEYSTYADLIATYPNLDVSGTNWFVNDFVEVVSDENQTNSLHTQGSSTVYRVVVDGNIKTLEYQKDISSGVATNVAIATNTSFGVIKGDSTTLGKQFIETDGTMSTNGWDDMTAKVNAALPKNGGILSGTVVAGGNQNIDVGQVRNIIISNVDLTENSLLDNGTIYFVYE